MSNSPTPGGAQEATGGRESASTGEFEAQGVQSATDAAERRTAVPDPELRRALAVDAVGPAAGAAVTWPPLCPDCDTQHLNSCEDAAEYRALVAAVCGQLADAFRPRTPMADIPAALRGPNWPGPNTRDR